VIAFSEVSIGAGGLPACSRCSAEVQVRLRDSAEVVRDIRSAVEQWKSGPGPNVVLGRAEPFLHPELPSIVGAARDAGVRRLRLVTGGGALGVGENASGSIQAGVRHLELVLLSGEASIHDALWGRDGALAAALKGVERFSEAATAHGMPIALTGRIPVCRHNAASVPSAVGALGAAGAVSVVIQPAPEGGFAPDAAWLAAVADTGMVNRVWVTFSGWTEPLPGSTLHAHAPYVTLAGTS